MIKVCTCLAWLTVLEASMKENGKFSLAKYQSRALCESLYTSIPQSIEMFPLGSPQPKGDNSQRINALAPSLSGSQFLETFFAFHR